MSSYLAFVLSALLLLLAAHGWICALLFVRNLRTAKTETATDAELPRAAVLMGLKGADPDLLEGLKRLIRQDYPDFELHIVVDSHSDPAWDVVQQAMDETNSDRVHVDVYRPSIRTGPVNSTNSKQVQSLLKLDDTIQMVAMADGDLLAHSSWLRELVAPMVRDPAIGATYGNRWFMPTRAGWGSLVRYIWNVAAVVSMYFLKMPWGGCFAIRMSVIRDLGLAQKWARVIAFDASTPRDLERAGMKLKLVPALMMPNFEECRLGFCHNFFQRQLTWTRLYHPRWPVVASYALFAGGVPVLSWLFVFGSLAGGEFFAAGWVAAGLLVNVFAQGLLFAFMQRHVESAMAEKSGAGWFDAIRAAKLLLVLPVTQLIQLSALLAAIFCRRVRWRGIVLDVRSASDIRMVKQPIALADRGRKSARESL